MFKKGKNLSNDLGKNSKDYFYFRIFKRKNTVFDLQIESVGKVLIYCLFTMATLLDSFLMNNLKVSH